MITIIHGEDTLSSYRRFTETIEGLRSNGLRLIIKDAGEIDQATLRQETGAVDLFGGSSCLAIKNLLSGVRSKQKEGLIAVLKKGSSAEIILYETKKLTETALKPFKGAKIEAFNINPVIFKFLDLLRPGNTRVILLGWNRLVELGHEPEYVYSMVVRQIRLLIQAKSGASYLKLSPYPKKLITAQANYFTLNHLLDLHYELYETDKRIKTGFSPLPLEQLLYQFFLNF